MKKSKKLVSLLLSFAVAASLLTACNTNKKEDNNPAGQKSASTATTTQAAGTMEESWKKDTSPFTFDWFENRSTNTVWNEEAPVIKKIMQDTGVKVNFMPMVGAADEKLNTMIAANSLPDVVTMFQNAGQFKQLAGAGRLHAINKLAEKSAPAVNKLIPKSLYDWWKEEDGNLYGFPDNFWASEKMSGDLVPDTNAVMFARKDIMDQLGIKPEDFKTQDGMVAALKKVKDANIQYKGVKVTPIYYTNTGGNQYTLPSILPDYFSVPREDKDGNYIDRRLHPKFTEVITFSNRLYREGLMSMENFTAQLPQIREKYQQGSIFCMIGNRSDMKNEIQNLMKADPKAISVPVGPVLSKDGAKPLTGTAAVTGWRMTMITKNAKNPERIIRFFDYMMREETQILCRYGIEGVHYEKGGKNGHLKWTKAYDEERLKNSTKAGQSSGVGMFTHLTDPIVDAKYKPLPDGPEELAAEEIRVSFNKFNYDTRAFGGINPAPSTDEATMFTEIDTLWRNEVVKAVIQDSEEKAIKYYEGVVKKMKDMGADKVNKIENKNFQDNKKKMGVKFAWPEYLK